MLWAGMMLLNLGVCAGVHAQIGSLLNANVAVSQCSAAGLFWFLRLEELWPQRSMQVVHLGLGALVP